MTLIPKSSTPPDQGKRRLFRYHPMEEASVRKPFIEDNPVLTRIEEGWREYAFKYSTNIPGNPGSAIDPAYKKARAIAAELMAFPEDIELFSIVLMKYSGEPFVCEKSGLFISALMSASEGSLFVIRTSHLDFAPWYLGYRNGKDFIVEGDTGDFFCSRMSDGLVEIAGNAGKSAGLAMIGGSIVIHGDCEGGLGTGKTGGEIVVRGRVL